MLATGIVLLIGASLLHCFFAANAGARNGYQAGAYIRFGRGLLYLSVGLLVAAILTIWVVSSFVLAALSIAIYFLLLPLLIMPWMRKIYPPSRPKAMSEKEWEDAAGLHEPAGEYLDTKAFGLQLLILLQEATENNIDFIDINAGELHRLVGGYPGRNHRMPICCGVMKGEMREADEIRNQPPKGVGASLTIRYRLPRPN